MKYVDEYRSAPLMVGQENLLAANWCLLKNTGKGDCHL